MIIASDIGGVVRDLATGERIKGSIKSLRHFQSLGHQIVFLSKCKPGYEALINEWLVEHHIQDIPIHFCRTYEEKQQLAANVGIQCMIDDKVQVLQYFPSSVMKVWYCNEEKRIQGLAKHDTTLYQSLHICRTWQDIVTAITSETDTVLQPTDST